MKLLYGFLFLATIVVAYWGFSILDKKKKRKLLADSHSRLVVLKQNIGVLKKSLSDSKNIEQKTKIKRLLDAALDDFKDLSDHITSLSQSVNGGVNDNSSKI